MIQSMNQVKYTEHLCHVYRYVRHLCHVYRYARYGAAILGDPIVRIYST
jgi:hypothetical protein